MCMWVHVSLSVTRPCGGEQLTQTQTQKHVWAQLVGGMSGSGESRIPGLQLLVEDFL